MINDNKKVFLKSVLIARFFVKNKIMVIGRNIGKSPNFREIFYIEKILVFFAENQNMVIERNSHMPENLGFPRKIKKKFLENNI